MEFIIAFIVIVGGIGIPTLIHYYRGTFGGTPAERAAERAAAREAELNKPIDEMTPAEKAKNLRFAEHMYRCGKLSFAQYDALKAAYTVEESFAQKNGMDLTMAASDKLAADKALERHKEETQKRIITNSAIGNAVGGVAGGIAGAVSTAGKASIETEQLMAEQDKANKRYEEALKRSIK